MKKYVLMYVDSFKESEQKSSKSILKDFKKMATSANVLWNEANQLKKCQ